MMNKDNIVRVDIKKYMDYLIIGHNVTSYRNPMVIEEINEFNGNVTMVVKSINGYNLAFDKDNFISMVKEYLNAQD